VDRWEPPPETIKPGAMASWASCGSIKPGGMASIFAGKTTGSAGVVAYRGPTVRARPGAVKRPQRFPQ
jgi:hypothetical protein